MQKIIIIGGGIAGLAAAYYASKQTETPVEITLLEQADYWGGKLITDRVPYQDGQFVVEGGPDTFVVTKPWGVGLCKELGLTERLRGTNPETKKTYILKNDKLHELPGGLTMMIPTEFGPFPGRPRPAWGWISFCQQPLLTGMKRWVSLLPAGWDVTRMKA